MFATWNFILKWGISCRLTTNFLGASYQSDQFNLSDQVCTKSRSDTVY